MYQIIGLFGALLLAAVHVVTPLLRFLNGTPRSAWLSAAGGVSVAYIFIHLLPELSAGASQVGGLGASFIADREIYLVAMAGLLTFYGLDRFAQTSRSANAREEGADASGTATGPGVFWIHIVSFAAYNALVGYLILRGEHPTQRGLSFFIVAMALHFLVTDYGLSEHHKERYRRIGRWFLIAAVLAGYLVGTTNEVSGALTAMLTAFLGGGVILNVLKEEVPSERKSRFWAFALGSGGYAALLLSL